MRPSTLLAKSARCGAAEVTLLEHTSDVMEAARALLKMTGEAQLRAFGLDIGIWLGRFARDLLVAVLLHDLGKSNSCFQAMIRDPHGGVRQPIRHEAVSYWIARLPVVREWIDTCVGDRLAVYSVLWAIAGHHRKFPPDPCRAEEMAVYLGHDDFRRTLEWGAQQINLPAPPILVDSSIRFTPARASVALQFQDEAAESAEQFEAMRNECPDWRNYVALLKACLIGSDVAGSIRRRGNQTMVEWIEQAFRSVPTIQQLDSIVTTKLGGNALRGFQEEMGRSPRRVVFVRAGCGSGKTAGAYRWAARTAERLGRNLRVYFCYPTTGTASEGYRDYLKDVDVDAALIHGRAEVDMELLGLGDDEGQETQAAASSDSGPGRSAAVTAGALEHWSTPLVSCTVDTVLGLLQNNRRGVYLWPSLAGSAFVFDEIHAYDDRLFAALLRFLRELRGIPCLLMTASLPQPRCRQLVETLRSLGEEMDVIPGPEKHETIKRYRRLRPEQPWVSVCQTLLRSGKVLWVVNTVDEAIRLADCNEARPFEPMVYHSRFRYMDRVERHKDVIGAFKGPGPVLAFCTQVAEMSLDISADLLVTQLAPIPALIQRLGRLNRRATGDDPWPFIVTYRDSPSPYEQAELEDADRWLDTLGDAALSQRDLASSWTDPENTETADYPCLWLDGGFKSLPGPLRDSTPGIEIIMAEDEPDVRSGRSRPELVRIPMTMPRSRDWREWPEIAFCKVPPAGFVDYDPRRGARWKT